LNGAVRSLTPAGGTRRAWLDDPLLRATRPPREIKQHWGEPLKKMMPEEVARRCNFEADGRNAIKLRAAGMRIVDGTHTPGSPGSGSAISTTWTCKA
jgi:hypothetical protein